MDGSVNKVLTPYVATTVPFRAPPPVLSHCYHGSARGGSLRAVVATPQDVLTVVSTFVSTRRPPIHV